MRHAMYVLVSLLITMSSVFAQGSTPLRVIVRHDGAPVEGSSVQVDGVERRTDATGQASFMVSAGEVVVTVVKERLAPMAVSVTVSAEPREVVVNLEEQEAVEEHVTVSATRTDTRLEDQPLRVEVLTAEEIAEKVMMTPGDIVMMLNEMGGLRVQATAPSLGAASVRIQGMQGRYTRFLADGLPLFGEVGSLGLLQIPPMDLGSVEVIKGVASSLYGAGAMGGVVNLVSRRPGVAWERDAVVNRSSRGATDAVAWMGGPISAHWSATLLTGGHGQQRDDIDGDGWADLPEYVRGVVRPRFFWDDGTGRSFFTTVGVTVEDRNGGTVEGAVLPHTGMAYPEALGTVNADIGALVQSPIGARYIVTARGAFSQQRHKHIFGEVIEHDRHDTGFGEVAVRGATATHSWVAGAAVELEKYRPRELPQFEYTYVVPGAFAQDDVRISNWLSLSVSGRVDHHSEYGTFLSPRIAGLVRRGHWSSRLSVGTGFFGPGPLTEETEAAGLTRLQVVQPLRAEKGRAASVDVSRTDGPVTYTATLFASRVSSPIYVARDEQYALFNLDQPTTNRGAEVVVTFRRRPFSLTSTYAYVLAREQVNASAQDVPLTPRHSAGLVGMWEREGRARIGLEWYYTGVQHLEDNPYRSESRPYSVFGALAERQFGQFRLFVNGENLTNVRQTHWDPLLRPTRASDGRWTTDAWAPLDGRNVNAGVRFRF